MVPIVFLSYAHADKKHIAPIKFMLDELQREDKIALFHDGEIRAGQLWDSEIESHLREATHFLVCMSDDYIVSEYVRKNELPFIGNKVKAKVAKAFPLLIKDGNWETFLLSDSAAFLKPAQFWPVLDDEGIVPLCDLSPKQRGQQLKSLREQVIAATNDLVDESIRRLYQSAWWAGSKEQFLAGLADLRLPDSIDVRLMHPALTDYLAKALAYGDLAGLVSDANELLYEMDSSEFSRRKIPEPPFNVQGAEEPYWSGVLLDLSRRSPMSIVVVLALAYQKKATGVAPNIENILDGSKREGDAP